MHAVMFEQKVQRLVDNVDYMLALKETNPAGYVYSTYMLALKETNPAGYVYSLP